VSNGNRGRQEAGFTLVEVVVALGLIVVLATGAAVLVPLTVRAVHAGRDQTIATWLAVQRMEDLRALRWRFDGSAGGAPVSDTTTDLSTTPFNNTGTGLLPSPFASLDVNTPGYVDYLDQHGVWVGTGATPPSAAVYIRRWRIAPVLAGPNSAVLLHVLVTSVRRDVLVLPAAPRLHHLVDAMVVTLRTRQVS
jgi:prepilin-type N-terminal cleavage/methylation domain-containing protein